MAEFRKKPRSSDARPDDPVAVPGHSVPGDAELNSRIWNRDLVLPVDGVPSRKFFLEPEIIQGNEGDRILNR